MFLFTRYLHYEIYRFPGQHFFYSTGGVSNTDSFDDGYEENSRPAKPKEKKKIRKVMSWNT